MIEMFTGDYGFLSNFYPSRIVYCNIIYPTVEHFYQAMKSKERSSHLLVAACPKPGQAKKLGRELILRPDWEDVKLKVMAHGLRLKFEIPVLRQKLIDTYPHALVEGNYWHDNIWGDCLCKKCSSSAGRNLLGQLLELLREHLINGTLPADPDPDF